MGRNPKPSVRFIYAKKKQFPFQTVRICLTYKGKRLYSTDESNNWYGFNFELFNSDGTVTLPENTPEKEAYIKESEGLLYQAQSAIMIAEEAEKRGVWEAMTSKDFAELLSYMGEHRTLIADKKKGGQNDFQAISEQMYEWRWQRVGKGKV